MSRRPFIRALLVPALSLGAVLALAGCGDATDTSRAADAAADPTSVASSAASEPTWPATGCEERVQSQLDYGRAPDGWKTPEEAVAHAADSSIPAGTVVVAPSDGGGSVTVWVVDDASQTILASVSLAAGPSGLYVDGVERCA
jgi:hypothetical protein